MKKLFVFFTLIIFFVYALLYFAPKKNMIYFLQEKADTQKIHLNYESLQDTGFGLESKNLQPHYEQMPVATVARAEVTVLFFYNRAVIEDFSTSEQMQRFLPPTITEAEVRYSVLDPLRINIEAKNKTLTLNGHYDLISQKLRLELQSQGRPQLGRQLLRHFKKIEGTYVYEKTIALY